MPHRLVERTSLKAMARRHTPTGEDTWMDRLRFAVIAKTPTVLIDYLFEGLLAFVALTTGIIGLAGKFAITSLALTLPLWLLQIYGVMLIVGGATIVIGMAIRRYGTILPAGLRLLTGTCAVYALAVVLEIGVFPGLGTVFNSILIAIFAGWRAFLLRSTFILVSKDADVTFYRKD